MNVLFFGVMVGMVFEISDWYFSFFFYCMSWFYFRLIVYYRLKDVCCWGFFKDLFRYYDIIWWYISYDWLVGSVGRSGWGGRRW